MEKIKTKSSLTATLTTERIWRKIELEDENTIGSTGKLSTKRKERNAGAA